MKPQVTLNQNSFSRSAPVGPPCIADLPPRLLLCAFALLLACSSPAATPKNFFANPGFELGQEGWQVAKAGKTEVRYSVDEKDATEGQRSALLTLGAVEQWGLQFGQSFPAGDRGKTYTFAAFAKSVMGPVAVGLEIERTANPYDRAAHQEFTLGTDWKELHVTFRLEKEFREGWFAYVSCAQPHAEFRVDQVRLYEGPYVPFKEIAKEEIAAVAVRLFDDGTPSATPLAALAFTATAGWKEIPEDTDHPAFQGDAVLLNDRVGLVLRRGAPGAEVYSLGPTGAVLRTVLAPAASTNAVTLDSFAIAENNPSAGAADVVFTSPGSPPLAVRFTLKVGQPVIQTESKAGATRLRVEAPCRFAVLPDFFADDIVVDAADLPVREADLPSDNFLLHLLPGGDALVMTVAQTSEEDLHVTMAGEGDKRLITGSELKYGKGGKIWVAVLAAPSIWHTRQIGREQTGEIISLHWKAPFPAQWRADWRREEDVTDSWEMLAEQANGSYAKFGVFGGPDTLPANRQRWNTVLGTFKYPCWLDQNGHGYLQPLKTPVLRFQGPTVIYPINRVSATALDTFTVIDIVRNTLGVGPCEYILDVEGQRSQYKGRATCSVRDTLNPIYASHQQQQRRAEIQQVLEDLMIFVRHIRGRIESYVVFEHETLDYLAQQRQAHAELAGGIAELTKLARVIDAKFEARKAKIKTPEDTAKLVGEFRQTVLAYEGDDALAKCKFFTEAWVEIGGNQDELAGECRWAVKMLRQKAGLIMATDPRMAEIAKEIRSRSQVVLRNPANHESARH